MYTWSLQYDALNRLAAASDNQSGTPNTNYCWSYDDFGNRTAQAGSNQPFTNAVGASTCQPASGATFNNAWAHYTVDGTLNTPNNGKNQLTATPAGNLSYDAAGNVTFDGAHQYLYDAEGRICASAPASAPGIPQLPATGYIYDADGTRVAKGTITTWSCDPIAAGFQTTSDYILGPDPNSNPVQAAEMAMDANQTLTWLHTNVYAAGALIATYDGAPSSSASAANNTNTFGLHFYFNDPLGSRRAQTDAFGLLEQTCASLPFGDALTCTGSTTTPTEHHFTGKERDVETGNDYFEARYYSSALGRFMSPDWSAKEVPVPYAKLGDPQSLNLYTYIRNNPLGGVDADGHQQGGVATAPEVAEPTLADILSINASAPFYDLFSLVRLGGSAALVPFALVQPMGDGTFDGALRNPYNAPHRTPGVCYLDRDEPLVETSPLPEAAAGGFGAFGRGRGGRRIPGPIHGNDLSTAVPAQGYSLQDRTTGAILKYGETTLGTGRYTDAYLKAHNANMVFETSGTKKEMHKWQHDKIIEYMQQNGGNRPPLNKNNY